MSNARKRSSTPTPTPKPTLLQDVNTQLTALTSQQAANDAARKTHNDRLILTVPGNGYQFKVTLAGGLVAPGGYSFTPEQCQQIRTFLNSVFSPIA